MKNTVAKIDQPDNLVSTSPSSDKAKVDELLARARALTGNRPRQPQILHPMVCSVHGGRYLGIIEERDGQHIIIGSQALSWRGAQKPSTSVASELVILQDVQTHPSWVCPLCRRSTQSTWVCCMTGGSYTIHCGSEGTHAQVCCCACGKREWRGDLGPSAIEVMSQIARTPQSRLMHRERSTDFLSSTASTSRDEPPQIGCGQLLLPGKK